MAVNAATHAQELSVGVASYVARLPTPAVDATAWAATLDDTNKTTDIGQITQQNKGMCEDSPSAPSEGEPDKGEPE